MAYLNIEINKRKYRANPVCENEEHSLYLLDETKEEYLLLVKNPDHNTIVDIRFFGFDKIHELIELINKKEDRDIKLKKMKKDLEEIKLCSYNKKLRKTNLEKQSELLNGYIVKNEVVLMYLGILKNTLYKYL